MFCVVQEIELKKFNRYGKFKNLEAYYSSFTVNGIEYGHYAYRYGCERFERPIKTSYKVSIHESYREDGKVKKRQYSLFTISYYDIVEGWFCLDEYYNRLELIADKLGVDSDVIYEVVSIKLDPLIKEIISEYSLTEESIKSKEHEQILKLYRQKKQEFSETYECDDSVYDEIYDVFGSLRNETRLQQVKADYVVRKEYEKRSSSYQYNYNSNHSNSSYFNNSNSNYNEEDKDILKQFYRTLSKKFHPDANLDVDTSNQMKVLNQLKSEWGL